MSTTKYSAEDMLKHIEAIYQSYNSKVSRKPKPKSALPETDYMFAPEKAQVRKANEPLSCDELIDAIRRKFQAAEQGAQKQEEEKIPTKSKNEKAGKPTPSGDKAPEQKPNTARNEKREPKVAQKRLQQDMAKSQDLHPAEGKHLNKIIP